MEERMNPATEKTAKIRKPEIFFGYLIGPFGGSLASGIFTSILQNYFTDVLKLNLSFLVTLQLVSTILIVIANLVVGQLIERTRSMAGKARPWILLSAFTISITSILMFIVPFEGMGKKIWIAIAYNLFYSIAFPIYNTANATLVAVSTRDSQERGTLATFMNVSGLAVMGVGSMIFPILVSFALKEDGRLWLIAFTAIAVFSAFTIFLQYRFTRERATQERDSIIDKDKDRKDSSDSADGSIRAQLKAVCSEKFWWIIMIFYVVFQLSGAMKNGSMAFFCKWVLNNASLGSEDAWGISQSILSIAGALPMAIAAVLVIPLAKRFGKRSVCAVGLFLGAVGGVIAGIGGENIIPVAIGVGLKCLGSAPVCYLILAMLADVIDLIEEKRHLRTDGLTMSIYSSIMVAATPIMNAIFSGILNGAGYSQNADVTLGTAAQTLACGRAISISYIWIETISYVICGILIIFWKAEPENTREVG